MPEEKKHIKATLRQSNLRYMLDRVRGSVGRMHPYFMIDFYLSRVTCCATDLRVGAVCEIQKRDGESIDMCGTACVPAGKMWSIIEKLPDQFVTLTGLDNNRLEISCGSYSGVIACVNHQEHFPDMVIPGGAPDVECSGAFLNDIYAAIGHAIGCIEEEPMSGINLRAENGRLVGVACDGHRLSVAAVSIPYDEECDPFNNGITLSGRAVGEIKKLSCGHSDIRFRENRMSIEQVGITIIARLFEKEFPSYRRVIPRDHPYCAVVSTCGLIDVIDRVSVLAESQGITLQLRPGMITVSGESSAGIILDRIDCQKEGGDVDICVTPRYLLDALKALKSSDDVVIKYRDPVSPVLILPADHSNWDERLELIVPRRA